MGHRESCKWHQLCLRPFLPETNKQKQRLMPSLCVEKGKALISPCISNPLLFCDVFSKTLNTRFKLSLQEADKASFPCTLGPVHFCPACADLPGRVKTIPQGTLPKQQPSCCPWCFQKAVTPTEHYRTVNNIPPVFLRKRCTCFFRSSLL